MAKPKNRTESASDQPSSSMSETERIAAASGDQRERIATRAYELYLARGSADGGDFDDWLAAEREIGIGDGSATRGDSGE